MIRALVSGTLHVDPMVRTSQTGKPYTTAKLRADGKDGTTVWCNLVAFGEISERLSALKAGAALSVSGRAEVSGWVDKEGDPHGSLSLVVDELVTLRTRPKPSGKGKHSNQESTGAAGMPFDDLEEWTA